MQKKKTLTAEERAQKLERLKELKKKLDEIEKEKDQSHAIKKSDSKDEAEQEVWIPPSDEKNQLVTSELDKNELVKKVSPESKQPIPEVKVKQVTSKVEPSLKEQPTKEQPIKEQPVKEQPIKEQPVKEQPTKSKDDEEYLNKIDEELEDLEKMLADDMDLSKLGEIGKAEETISQSFDTLSKPIKVKEKQEKIKQPKIQTTTQEPSANNIDQELQDLENEINLQQAKSAVVVSLFDQLCEEHEWIKQPQYGFMYSVPDKKKDAKDFESWLDEWSKVLFDYARIASEHIVNSKELLAEKPWSEFKDRTSAIQEISDSLVKQKVAGWLDKKKERLRVYWKSLEGWADYILDWAQRLAITEPILIQDIKNSEEPFNSLPEEDIIKIFNILEKRGVGVKTKLKNGDYAITLRF